MKCENCKNEHDGNYGSGRFCCKLCARSYSTKKKRNEINKKVSETLTGRVGVTKGREFVKKKIRYCLNCFKPFKTRIKKKQKCCSRSCASTYNVNQQIKNGTFAGWKTRNIISYPERFFIRVLKNKLQYIHNYPIKKKALGLHDSYSWFLDFYIPKYKLDLEIDGRQHDYQHRKEADNFRDKILKKNGFIVYRIRWKSINKESGRKYIKKEIDNFFEFIKHCKEYDFRSVAQSG